MFEDYRTFCTRNVKSIREATEHCQTQGYIRLYDLHDKHAIPLFRLILREVWRSPFICFGCRTRHLHDNADNYF